MACEKRKSALFTATVDGIVQTSLAIPTVMQSLIFMADENFHMNP